MGYKIIYIAWIILITGCLVSKTGQSNLERELDYSSSWKEVDSLEQNGFPLSAIQKVLLIKQHAKETDNWTHYLKATIHEAKYRLLREEDAEEKILQSLESELPILPPVEASILRSYLGSLYVDYLFKNGWRWAEPVKVAMESDREIGELGVDEIEKRAMRFYLQSISDPEILQISILRYAELLEIPDTCVIELRPTLYDVLVSRALDYIGQEPYFLPQPPYIFSLNRPEFSCPYDEFINIGFEFHDTFSHSFQAMKIYQDWMRAHVYDSVPDVRVDIDLKRLKYLWQHSSLNDRDSVYQNALIGLERKYLFDPVFTEIAYNHANLIYHKGFVDTEDRTDEFSLAKARSICQEAIQRFPNSYGSKLCRALVRNIEMKSVSMETEQVILPNENTLIRLDYRNVSRMYFRVVPVARSQWQELRNAASDSILPYLLSQIVLYEWKEELPLPSDYANHSAEIRIPRLPTGLFGILCSSDENFEETGNTVGYSLVFASNLSITQLTGPETASSFLCVHRKSGFPLKNIRAEWYAQRRNTPGRITNFVQSGITFSDSMGILRPPDGNSYLQRLTVQKGEDWLELDQAFHYFQSSRSDDFNIKTHFFTDRAIYRPGQTVYFKGLVISEFRDSIPQLVKDHQIRVFLYDSNRKVIAEQKFTTSSFGSFSGNFILPANGLEGTFEISSDAGSSSAFIRVEQYIRPTFLVNIDTLSSGYKIGDTILISGNAEAFAGFRISGADYTYKVTRRAFIPWLRGYDIYPTARQKEIVIGEGKTDSLGQFEFRFPALAELSIPRHYYPEFLFELEVSVTDLNGESQSTNESILLGFTEYRFRVDIPEYTDIPAFSNIRLVAENYQGYPVDVKGLIVIKRIQPKTNWTRKRYWEMPEFEVMQEDSFKNMFPLDAFRKEHNMESWRIKEENFTRAFNTQSDTYVDVSGVQWEPGYYRLEAWISGRETPFIQFFQLWDIENRIIPSTDLLSIYPLQDRYEPGDTAELMLSSAQYPAYVFLQTNRLSQPLKYTWLKLEKPMNVRVPVLETDRGGIHITANRRYENRVVSVDKLLEIPWSNKDLQLEVLGLPEKMLPGANGQFTVKIKTPGPDFDQAEVLVAMYDASLDHLFPHKWNTPQFPFIWGGYWFRDFGYGSKYGIFDDHGWNPQPEIFTFRVYPFLNNYGLHFQRIYWMRAQNETAGAADAVVSDTEKLSAEPPSAISKEKTDENGSDAGETRSDLGETVFFYTDLKTDSDGNVPVEFFMKDALTRWRLMVFAHTSDLSWGIFEKDLVTQKDMMIIPNLPRFLRQADTAYIKAKISNLTGESITGQATLDLKDIVRGKWMNETMLLSPGRVSFELMPGQSKALSWSVQVPDGLSNPVQYYFKAASEKLSDGQTGILPVLTNRVLITESMILPVEGGSSKEFRFSRFEDSNSPTLEHYNYSISYESNPLQHVLMAIPSLLNNNSHCSEEIFNSLFGWTLGSEALSNSPELASFINAAIIEQGLAGNGILPESVQFNLNETPWLQEALIESNQINMLNWLQDQNLVRDNQLKALTTLKSWQNEDGGFPWFRGGRTNWFVTQNIIEGFGNMKYLKEVTNLPGTDEIIKKALRYLDLRIEEEYVKIADQVSKNRIKWSDDCLSPIRIHYLYVRSMFPEYPFYGQESKVWDFFLDQAGTYWKDQIPVLKGMISLALSRYGRKEVIPDIIRSLKEFSVYEKDKGVHWKTQAGSLWYQFPVETQALLMTAFHTLSDDEGFSEELCTWLLAHKATNRWPTSKSTASAVFALWLQYGDRFDVSQPAEIVVNNNKLEMDNEISTRFRINPRYTWYGPEINKTLSVVEITNPNQNMTWGSIQWQYFETPENVNSDVSSDLSLKKTLFKYVQSDEGTQLAELKGNEKLEVGDKIKVFLQIRSAQDMEFIKVKDMRAAGFEPIEQLSDYTWSDGIGYYKNPEDLATNFYIEQLPRGYHRIEYDLVVNLSGNFSSGLATVESMYAPQYRSHSASSRIRTQ